MDWCFKNFCDVNLLNSLSLLENLPSPEIKASISNPCWRQITRPKWMKFWHKKRQYILFKTRSISNTWLLASVSKSLMESDNSAGWPGSCSQVWAYLSMLACFGSRIQITVRLIKKVTTFSIVLHCLNSTNLIVIHEHFKELQKMNNLPPVPSNLIN